MDLSKILSVSGKPDLYKHIAQSKNGIVVESLIDGKRMNAFATMRISALQDIAIYTTGEDVPLDQVFRNLFRLSEGKESLSHKVADSDIVAEFAKVLPEYDRDRVYVSDMKRVFKWYNILLGHGLVDDNAPEKKEEAEVKTEAETE